MPQIDFANSLAANAATANTAETVIATARTASSPAPGSNFFVQFGGVFTAGASTTGVTFQIRRNSLTGTSIYTSGLLTITAAQLVAVNFAVVDAIVGDVASAVWVLTAAQTAGAAPGGLTNAWSSVTVPV